MLVGGVSILGVALATGVSGDRLIGAAVPVLLMLGIGAMVVHAHAPLRKTIPCNARIAERYLSAKAGIEPVKET